MTNELHAFVAALADDPAIGPRIVHHAHLPASPATTATPDPLLPKPVVEALAARGIDRLWSHQAVGLAALGEGEDVLVTTPTASGKSLIFQLPVLAEAARGGAGKALFLFPLKALGQDQKSKLDALAAASGLPPEAVRCEIYDGDTPAAKRAEIKQDPPRVLITNPDMLHLAVLSYGDGWRPFLADLEWLVLDELHTYRGIFGSHFHHVLQRFGRLVREIKGPGAAPRVVASSATAANATEFAHHLTGRSFRSIDRSGAPREGRHLLLLRPDGSPYTAALDLFVRLLDQGLKTIVFTKARRITELLYSWLKRQRPELARRVASYRAGFLPQERRGIERKLFNGRLDGVISTSALEMGIDVGGLDACVLVGFPGSMMATWQRSGRVGRSGRESLTALVAMPDALDQYFLDHPQELLSRPCERLVVDPANEPVARAHLVCAAAELPLSPRRDADLWERHHRVLDALVAEQKILRSADGDELFATRRRPQRDVHLRGSGATYTIEDCRKGRIIGTVDGVRALHECHAGAVYLHAGRQWLVRELDLAERRARAERARLDYFTTPLTSKETDILEVLEQRRDGPLEAWLGRLRVTERVVGFERKRIHGQELIDQQPLDLPPVSYETVGLWWAAGPEIEESLRLAEEHFLGSLHATEHAAISLFPLLAICDRGDIGGISMPFHPQVGSGCVFVYDGHPGGVGIAARGFADLPDLLSRVLELLDDCGCEAGCPSCIQSPKCGNGNRPLDKSGARRVLRLLLDREVAAATARRREPLAPIPPVAEEVDAVEVDEVDPSSEATASPQASTPSIQPTPTPPTSTPIVHRGALLSNTVLFDLETRRSAAEVGGWGNCHKMGVALGVVCHLEEGRFDVFDESGVGRLVAALEAAELVVGFNVKRFDYRVLAGYTGVDYTRKLPTLDLLDDLHRVLGFRVGLDSLARATLGTGKTADGLQCLEWVAQGRMDLVEEYCKKDVEVLRDLYLHGRREGHVLYADKKSGQRLEVSVDW